MKKVCIYTLGCRVNQYESVSIAEALQEKGFVDMIVERKKMRKTLAKILSIHAPEEKEV